MQHFCVICNPEESAHVTAVVLHRYSPNLNGVCLDLGWQQNNLVFQQFHVLHRHCHCNYSQQLLSHLKGSQCEFHARLSCRQNPEPAILLYVSEIDLSHLFMDELNDVCSTSYGTVTEFGC